MHPGVSFSGCTRPFSRGYLTADDSELLHSDRLKTGPVPLIHTEVWRRMYSDKELGVMAHSLCLNQVITDQKYRESLTLTLDEFRLTTCPSKQNSKAVYVHIHTAGLIVPLLS
jgi:hypothetical protein